MSSFNLSDLEAQLQDITENNAGNGVSFAKKSLKLDSEEDGKLFTTSDHTIYYRIFLYS